jgi:hypothetical protein
MLLSAELFLLLLRSRELNVICKKPAQRTAREKKEVSRGLTRSVVLECFFFAPASVFLVFVAICPWIMVLPATSATMRTSTEMELASYGLMGIVSYGFPLLTIRRVVTAMAIGAIKEANRASIGHVVGPTRLKGNKARA